MLNEKQLEHLRLLLGFDEELQPKDVENPLAAAKEILEDDFGERLFVNGNNFVFMKKIKNRFEKIGLICKMGTIDEALIVNTVDINLGL